MKIDFYINGGNTLDETIEVDPLDLESYISAIKKYGYEDEDGNTYKFIFAKINKNGATVYLLTE